MTHDFPRALERPIYRLAVQRERERRGVTREQLAVALDVAYTTLVSWEQHASCPRAIEIPVIAHMLGCSTDSLFEEVTPAAEEPAA